jgi:hypothetical protein
MEAPTHGTLGNFPLASSWMFEEASSAEKKYSTARMSGCSISRSTRDVSETEPEATLILNSLPLLLWLFCQK